MNEAQKKVADGVFTAKFPVSLAVSLLEVVYAACDAVLAMPAEGELTREDDWRRRDDALRKASEEWFVGKPTDDQISAFTQGFYRAWDHRKQYARPLPVGQPSEEQIRSYFAPDQLAAIGQAAIDAHAYGGDSGAGEAAVQAMRGMCVAQPAEPSEPMVPSWLLEEEYKRGVMDGTALPSPQEYERNWVGVSDFVKKRRARILNPPPQDRVQVTQDRSHNWVVTLDGVQQGGIHATDTQAGLVAKGLRIGLKAEVR